MYYIYLLESLQNRRVYIGYTDDLKRRVQTHNSGKVLSTKAYRPWRLVYAEIYTSKMDAINREKGLKLRGQAIRELKRRIKYSLHPLAALGAR